MLLTVFVALGIMIMVAVPYLRQGSRILTPGGEQVVQRAKRQARRKPAAAAGSTWHGVVGFTAGSGRLAGRAGRRVAGAGAGAGRRVAVGWRPIGEVLHAGLDRLEGREPAIAGRPGLSAASGPAPIRHASAPDGPTTRDDRPDRPAGAPVIGRPRSIPAISGPIPEISAQPAGTRIDLRDEPRDGWADELAEPAAGVRHAR